MLHLVFKAAFSTVVNVTVNSVNWFLKARLELKTKGLNNNYYSLPHKTAG